MQPSDTIQVRIMEISGVRIDFKEIMSRVRWALHEEIGDKPWRFESESRLGQLNLVIRGQVWHELVECLKDSVGKKDGTVRAEEAMAEAMRRGLEKENRPPSHPLPQEGLHRKPYEFSVQDPEKGNRLCGRPEDGRRIWGGRHGVVLPFNVRRPFVRVRCHNPED